MATLPILKDPNLYETVTLLKKIFAKDPIFKGRRFTFSRQSLQNLLCISHINEHVRLQAAENNYSCHLLLAAALAWWVLLLRVPDFDCGGTLDLSSR